MAGIESLVDAPLVEAIGWALLHFVWQGAVVGAVTAITLKLLRRSAADVRYVIAAVSLSLMATLPIVTAVQAYRASQFERIGSTDMAAAVAYPTDVVQGPAEADAGQRTTLAPPAPTALPEFERW